MAYTKYSLTPADNNAAPPNGAPEGMLPSAVNDTMRDMMAQIRDVGDGIRGGTYTMTAPVITGGSISGLSSLSSTGVATFSAGSASAPAITTTGDTNTGIFFPSADIIAFTEGGAESMRITAAGNVGIGTVNPGARLHSISAAGTVQIRWSDATNGTANLDTASGLSRMWSNVGLAFGTGAETFTERMRITSSGPVLVGTASQFGSSTLSTSLLGIGIGTANSAGNYRQLYFDSQILYFTNATNQASLSAAGTWTNASDARLKNSITDIKHGLESVLATQPRSYKMNDLEGNYIGFVAQELQTVIPEVVSGNPEKQLGVDYGSLVAVAFKAIQQLKAELDSVKAELQTLKGN